jgi:serine/threonine protein kinase/tetratricopeptide (TPR) repeat protein
MTPEKWRRARDLFEIALTMPEPERGGFVRKESARDSELRVTVLEMLDGHQDSGAVDELLSEVAGIFPKDVQTTVFSTGEVLARRFEIVRFLGRGGMGEVYEAVDNELRENVAVKTVRSELAFNPTVLDRFKREVQRSRKVTHPNVCRIYDLFTTASRVGEDTPFLTMELLGGGTLWDLLAKRPDKRLDPEEFRLVMEQVCAGLDAAHHAGVLHRDLKSSNVMLRSGTTPLSVAITDFGLARFTPLSTTGSATQSSATTTGAELVGTVDYMSPELLAGSPPSQASDIYALGILMYEAATGVLPFKAESSLVAATMRLARDPAPPRSLIPDIRRGCETAILRCLARQPEARPRSGGEVARLIAKDRFWIPAWPQITPVTRRGLIAGGVMAAGAGVSFWALDRSAKPVVRSGKPIVLLGKIESPPDDQAVGAFRFLVASALANSPEVRSLSDFRMRRALTLMGVTGHEPPGEDVAREVGIREGVRYVVTGALRALANGHSMTLRVIEPQNRTVIAELSETANEAASFTAAAGRLVTKLLTAVGDAEAPNRAASQPLELVTTPSLDALGLFSRAAELYNTEGDYDRCRDLLRAAIQVDPLFAMAYEYEALTYAAQGREDAALEPVERAYELRKRTTDRERLQIEAVYHACRGDYDQSLEAFRGLTSLYPDEARFQRHLAHSYSVSGKTGSAVQCARKAVDLEESVVNITTLALALAEDGNPDGALTTLERAKSTGIDSPIFGWPAGFCSLMKDQASQARAAYASFANVEGHQRFARLQLVKCYLMDGQLDTAIEQLESDLAVDLVKHDSANEAHRRWWLGHLYLLLGDKHSSAVHTRALVGRPAAPAHLLALRYGAFLAHQNADSELLQTVVLKLNGIQTDYPSTRSQGIYSQASGWLSSLEGNPRAGRSRYARARALWPDVLNFFSFAQCLFDTEDYGAAATGFEDVIKAKGPALRWEVPLVWLAGHAYHARSKAALGDRAGAAAACDRFLRYWANARSEPKIVIEVKALRQTLS